MHFRRKVLLSCFTLAMGCGPAASGPTKTAPVTAARPAPTAPPPVPAGQRDPSDVVKKHWPFDAPPDLAAYMDAKGLTQTDLAKTLLPGLLAMAKGALDTPQAAAGLEAIATGASEVLAGFDERAGVVFIVRVDAGQKLDAARIEAILPKDAAPMKVEGSTARGWVVGDFALALNGDVLVGGSPGVVMAALDKRDGRHASTVPTLSLAKGDYLVLRGGAEGIDVHGTVTATPELFALKVAIDTPDEKIAKALEREATEMVAAANDPKRKAPPALQKTLEHVTIARRTTHVDLGFSLREPPADQARDLTNVVALAAYGFRQYVLAAKMAEARNVVGQIAKSVAASWETESNVPQAKRKLTSFPAVPKAVPKGVKYQSTDKDWAAWHSLHFSMQSPQFYQYEVRAAKDGESAEIVARGDLDGNGKTSQFKLGVRIDRKDQHLTFTPKIEETDPEE